MGIESTYTVLYLQTLLRILIQYRVLSNLFKYLDQAFAWVQYILSQEAMTGLPHLCASPSCLLSLIVLE